jgi:CheY-like chemotaxis protein
MKSETKHTRWMVVDDSHEILLLMRMLLREIHDAVDFFASPQLALGKLAASPGDYELVITDFEMPGMDGMELCRQARKLTPGLKIILATGSGFFTEPAAEHAGFCGLLNKPFNLSTFLETLGRAGIETGRCRLSAISHLNQN